MRFEGATSVDIIRTVFTVIFAVIQFVFLTGMLPAFVRPFIKDRDYKIPDGSNALTVAILLPFHKEHPASMLRTVRSIIHQDYPRDLMRVYLVINKGDQVTTKNIPYIENIFKASKITVKTITTDGGPLGKPHSMNQALKHIHEDVVVVFDADDFVQHNYISQVVASISEGATAVTTRVYRVGERGLHSKLILLDTFIWYNLYMPVYIKLSGYVPLSGEGLGVRRDYLEKIGGFPNSITEDAFLTVELATDGRRIAYLQNSHIVERAPLTFRALLKQRVRWFRGYYECIAEILRRRKSIGYINTIKILPAYMGPLISLATTLSFTIFTAYLIALVLHIPTLVAFITETIKGPVYYLAASLFFGGNLYFISMLNYYSSDTRFERYAPYIYLAFVYWYVIGITALVALFAREISWYKTERISHA